MPFRNIKRLDNYQKLLPTAVQIFSIFRFCNKNRTEAKSHTFPSSKLTTTETSSLKTRFFPHYKLKVRKFSACPLPGDMHACPHLFPVPECI